MRGINSVTISGNVGDAPRFGVTDAGTKACSFMLASERAASGGQDQVTTWIKVNVYGDALVDICQRRLVKGSYVILTGELMNRRGDHYELTEVRVRDLVFVPTASSAG